VAEGVRGQVTAVARQAGSRYAFYRGTAYVGQPSPARMPAPNAPPTEGPMQQLGDSLDANIKGQNFDNQMRSMKRLEERYKAAPMPGVQVEKLQQP
jgi:hypothetical protein